MAYLSRLFATKQVSLMLKPWSCLKDIQTMATSCKKVKFEPNCAGMKKHAFKEPRSKPRVAIKCMQYNKAQDTMKCKASSDKRQQNPECCPVPCPDMIPRLDDEKYRISDKAKRTYQQTWRDCPKIRIARRPICCYEKISGPLPMKKRKLKSSKKAKGKTACSQSKASSEFIKCSAETKGQPTKCPRKCMPLPCKCGRVPPKCNKVSHPSDCIRVCTPYPSFSECKRKKPKKRPPTECKCLRIPSICEVLDEQRKLIAKTKRRS